MGEVYLAQDTRLDRKVAIKFLNEEFSKDGEKLRRFIQEAKAASALNHPNILTVYEIGEVDGKNYIATELIDGETLELPSGTSNCEVDSTNREAVPASSPTLPRFAATLGKQHIRTSTAKRLCQLLVPAIRGRG
jgi:serine/threonine protein kinase